MNPSHRIIGVLLLLILVALLACGCYGPGEQETGSTGNTYLACVDAQAAVHWLGICDEACQADCQARAVGACP